MFCLCLSDQRCEEVLYVLDLISWYPLPPALIPTPLSHLHTSFLANERMRGRVCSLVYNLVWPKGSTVPFVLNDVWSMGKSNFIHDCCIFIIHSCYIQKQWTLHLWVLTPSYTLYTFNLLWSVKCRHSSFSGVNNKFALIRNRVIDSIFD